MGYYQLLRYRDGRGRSDIFAVSDYFLRYVESFRLAAGKVVRVARKNYKRGADSEYLHELKTPLSVISGYSKIAQDKTDEARRNEYLELIKEQAGALSKLCEDMLLLSRLDSQVGINLDENVRVDEQLRKAAAMLMQKYDGLEFDLVLATVIVRSNASMLAQIWLNLMDNALKYSAADIGVSCREDGGRLIVCISDEGGEYRC